MQEPTNGRYWLITGIISLMLALAIGLMWYQVDNAYKPNASQLLSIAEAKADLHKKVSASNLSYHDETLEVPTGVYVQSLNFDSANDVYLNGYLWQTYPASKNIIEPGVFFPEEVKGDAQFVLKYQKEFSGNITYGWSFEVTVRQPFDYSDYPLDHKTVWLRILSKDFNGNTLLIPDLTSYPEEDLTKIFGVDDQIVLGNWEIHSTFFDYKMNTYHTNFGFLDKTKSVYPELHFNVVLKRKFVNAFVVHLIPMLTVAVLLFATLLNLTFDENKLSVNGFSKMGAIGTVSALFFIVVISHVDIRTKFPSQGIVYIEYFYLVLYVVMVAMVTVSFIDNSKKRWYNVFLKDDALLVKLMFWPVSLGAMMVITYCTLF